VQSRGWVAARELQPGDELRSHDGRWLPVEGVRNTGREEVVYNCRVAEYHTYFVGDQEWGFSIWSHNSACVPGGAGAASGEASRVAPTSTQSALTEAAQRAGEAVGPGCGPVHGTRVHTAFKEEVKALGRGDLKTEVSYLNGRVVDYGTPGSVRLDVVEGPVTAPTAVYDLKTGSATLTPERIAEILRHLPNNGRLPDGSLVPVIEIR